MKDMALGAFVDGTLLLFVAVVVPLAWLGVLKVVAGVVRHLNDRRRFPGEMSARLRQMAEGREGGRG